MKLNNLFVLLIVCAITSSISYAQDSSSGCGLGWTVSQKNSLLSSLVRNFTNYTFSNTIAMTSGTSGCVKHSIVKTDKEAIYYAESNYHTLLIEMAKGDGEHLHAFSTTLGCKINASGAFKNMTKKKYLDILPSKDTHPDEMYFNVLRQIQMDPNLSANCHIS